MNTQNLITAIAQAQVVFKMNNPHYPTKLYLDNVHAMKLEWYMREHRMIPVPMHKSQQDRVIFNGMRVFPVMVAEEHLQII